MNNFIPVRSPAAPRIPPTVWALGLVSLFMDLSSETIHALLPLFLPTTLGASVAVVGLIDGRRRERAQPSNGSQDTDGFGR